MSAPQIYFTRRYVYRVKHHRYCLTNIVLLNKNNNLWVKWFFVIFVSVLRLHYNNNTTQSICKMCEIYVKSLHETNVTLPLPVGTFISFWRLRCAINCNVVLRKYINNQCIFFYSSCTNLLLIIHFGNSIIGFVST